MLKYRCEQCKDKGIIVVGWPQPYLIECRKCSALYGVPSCNRCEKVKEALIRISSRAGHNLCWFNPEVLRELMNIFHVSIKPPRKIPREEFEEG